MNIGADSILNKCPSICFFLLAFPLMLVAQPQSGDLFREHIWLPKMVKEKEKFLRVGGKLDYQTASQHMSIEHHKNGFLDLPDTLDLEKARKIEVVFELVQSHDDTKGLALQVNNNKWLAVPPVEKIPQPQSRYMLHSYPVLEVPIEYFTKGVNNQFKLRVDTLQRWNWPQHILYGIIFRIYYDEEKFPIEDFQVRINENNSSEESHVTISSSSSRKDIDRVDYLGKYLDFNFEGDGAFDRWHGHPHRGELRNHIGGSDQGPFFTVNWNTAWLPDQYNPIKIMARITHRSGLVQMSEVIDGPELTRSHHVELCKPYHQPFNWVTRGDTFVSKFSVHGDLEEIVSYQIAWRSWSPCYGQGVRINGHKVWDKEDPCYGYAEHLVEIGESKHLLFGENEIETGMTPLHDGKMVHGMEVQYPGIMVKVKYDSKQIRDGVVVKEGRYEDRPHFIVVTPSIVYYYDQAGGGLSRLIDREGIDWIDFKMQPWGEYPAAAASAYRGMPNFVHGSPEAGAGHPGHNLCISHIVDKDQIITESKSGKWSWSWQFFEDHAEVEMIKVDTGHAYWFLYEGVPGGKFDPGKQFIGSDIFENPKLKTWDFYAGDKFFNHFNWVYFGHADLSRILFLKQMEEDKLTDTFSYLGNSEKGVHSNDGMIVFGFGRADGTKPLLTKNHKFLIGLLESDIAKSSEPQRIAKVLNTLGSK